MLPGGQKTVTLYNAPAGLKISDLKIKTVFMK